MSKNIPLKKGVVWEDASGGGKKSRRKKECTPKETEARNHSFKRKGEIMKGGGRNDSTVASDRIKGMTGRELQRRGRKKRGVCVEKDQLNPIHAGLENAGSI